MDWRNAFAKLLMGLVITAYIAFAGYMLLKLFGVEIEWLR